jgi:hypothetical protein
VFVFDHFAAIRVRGEAIGQNAGSTTGTIHEK